MKNELPVAELQKELVAVVSLHADSQPLGGLCTRPTMEHPVVVVMETIDKQQRLICSDRQTPATAMEEKQKYPSQDTRKVNLRPAALSPSNWTPCVGVSTETPPIRLHHISCFLPRSFF